MNYFRAMQMAALAATSASQNNAQADFMNTYFTEQLLILIEFIIADEMQQH